MSVNVSREFRKLRIDYFLITILILIQLGFLLRASSKKGRSGSELLLLNP